VPDLHQYCLIGTANSSAMFDFLNRSLSGARKAKLTHVAKGHKMTRAASRGPAILSF